MSLALVWFLTLVGWVLKVSCASGNHGPNSTPLLILPSADVTDIRALHRPRSHAENY